MINNLFFIMDTSLVEETHRTESTLGAKPDTSPPSPTRKDTD